MNKIQRDLYVAYQHDYDLYGLQTSVPEYKLAWQLNRTLHWHLKKAADLALEVEGVADDSAYKVSNFVFTTTHRTFRLLRNQTFAATEPAGLLLPELPEWNFFLQVHDPSASWQPELMVAAVGALAEVKQVARIDVATVEHKDNLLF
ncbi:MAG: IPExxxVDY family protein [Tunicatimonas sp.]